MLRAPDDTKRTVFIGRTGTGKSQAALDLLSRMNWHEKPWVILDYKGEDIIEEILAQNKGKIKTIKPTDKPPKKPGLYYMPLDAKVSDNEVEAWLMKVHAQGNVGLFIDEGYAMPDLGNSNGFTLILTQGRSLKIPVICLYQRPVWMSRFAIAQADFIRVFKQGDLRDEKATLNFCAPATLQDGSKLGVLELDKLPEYYSLWRDVGQGKTYILQPAPQKKVILANYRLRLKTNTATVKGHLV